MTISYVSQLMYNKFHIVLLSLLCGILLRNLNWLFYACLNYFTQNTCRICDTWDTVDTFDVLSCLSLTSAYVFRCLSLCNSTHKWTYEQTASVSCVLHAECMHTCCMKNPTFHSDTSETKKHKHILLKWDTLSGGDLKGTWLTYSINSNVVFSLCW